MGPSEHSVCWRALVPFLAISDAMRHLTLALLAAALLTACTSPQDPKPVDAKVYEAQRGDWTVRVDLADSLTLTIIDSVDSPPSRQVVSCAYIAEDGTLSVPECPRFVASRRALADSLVAEVSYATGSDSARLVAERIVHPLLQDARVQDSVITSAVTHAGESTTFTFRRTR